MHRFKTPKRNGTIPLVLDPVEFLARVPGPRTNLTRFHAVFSTQDKARLRVMPGKATRAAERSRPSRALVSDLYKLSALVFGGLLVR